MSHFIIHWGGNKYKEYKYFKDYFNFNNVENIIECFAGSASMSFNIWLEYGDKFNYYINDKDTNLLKNEDIDDIFNKLNELKLASNTKETFKDLCNKKNNDIYINIAYRKLRFKASNSTLRTDYHNSIKYFNINKHQRLFQQFLRSPNVFISNDDWKDCYNRFKDDEKSLILFDPPYIDTDNNLYKENCRSFDVYNCLNDILNDIAKSYFILQKTNKNDELFKDWNELIIYDKIYSMKHRKTQHIVYSN